MRLTVEREHTLKELLSTACMCLRSHAHAPVPMSFCLGEIDEFESAMIMAATCCLCCGWRHVHHALNTE